MNDSTDVRMESAKRGTRRRSRGNNGLGWASSWRPGRYSMLCSVPSVIVRTGCILVYVPGRSGAGQEHDSRHGEKTRATFKKYA